MKVLKIIIFTAMAAFGVFGICCFLYPTVSNQINESYNESTINEYNHNVNTSSKTVIQAAFKRAEQYNEVIAADYFSEEISDYETVLNDYYNILNVDNGIMGTIEIPSIHVRLPVYHGESEDVLKKGAAHLEQTSFPIGGMNTRSCISAHSGFPSQKFFDDIDELVAGDDIIVTVYDRKLTYKVCGKEVIEPDDNAKLRVEKGRELLTLITCYPYGINSHRLLVNAERTYIAEAPATADEVVTHDSAKRSPVIPLICAVSACAVLFVAIRLVYRVRKKNAQKRK